MQARPIFYPHRWNSNGPGATCRDCHAPSVIERAMRCPNCVIELRDGVLVQEWDQLAGHDLCPEHAELAHTPCPNPPLNASDRNHLIASLLISAVLVVILYFAL